MLVDACELEVAHEDGLLFQARRERSRIVGRMPGEDKVRHRRHDFEPQRLQRLRQSHAACHHACARGAEVRIVFVSRLGGRLRKAVQRIRIEAVFHAVERFDQRRVPEREADPHAGQRARLRRRVHNQQVGIAVDERNGGLRAEIHISLIDHYDRRRVRGDDPLDLRQRQRVAGRSVRVREQHAACVVKIVVGADGEIVCQRHHFVLHAVQPRVGRIEAVRDVGKAQRLVVLEQRLKDVRQHFVRPVAGKNLFRPEADMRGDRLAQPARERIGITAQAVARLAQCCRDCRHHARRRRVRVLVGVQLDGPRDGRLFARDIGHKLLNDIAPISAHGSNPDGW